MYSDYSQLESVDVYDNGHINSNDCLLASVINKMHEVQMKMGI